LLAALSELRPSTGQIPMHSTLYDREIDGTSLDASYWMANLREPVLFGPAVRAALATDRPVLFVEVSPHPVLIPAIEDTIEESGSASAAIGSLMRDSPELESLLSSLATAYVRGCEPNWEALYPSGRFSALPTYPWQTKRYWVEHSAKTEITDVLTLDSPPSSVLDAVFAAAKELGADAMIEDMRLSEAPANGALRTVLRTEPDGWQFDVRRGCSRNGSLTAWTTVASGRMALDARRAEPDVGSFDLIRAWCQEPAPADGMRELWRRDGEAVGTASSADLMDACARTLAAAASSTPASPKPLYIKELRVLGALTGDVRVHARLHHVDVDVAAGDIRVLDHDNRTLAEVRGLRIDQSGAPVPEARLAQVSDRVGGFLAILTDLLRVTPEELSHTEPLASLGMDSLIAARLRNRLMRELGVSVTLRDLLGPRTVAQILNDLRQHDAEPSS
jgi:aryl carrier-like protein